MPDTVLGTRDIAVNNSGKAPFLLEAYILIGWEGILNTQIK